MCDLDNLEDMQKPHFIDPAYVGHNTALEAVEMLYKVAVPGVFCVRKPEDLHQTLLKDPFQVGFDATRMLRSLILECKVDRYRTLTPPNPRYLSTLFTYVPIPGSSSTHSRRASAYSEHNVYPRAPASLCIHTANERNYIHEDELRPAFKHLLKIKDKVGTNSEGILQI